MLNALKQLVGLAPPDRREVWYDKPVVVWDGPGGLYYSGTATVEYTPSQERYEVGHAEVFDTASGDRVFVADISTVRAFSDNYDQSNPWRLRWSRLGITASATDPRGRIYTLMVGRHATNFVLRHHNRPLANLTDLADEPTLDDVAAD